MPSEIKTPAIESESIVSESCVTAVRTTVPCSEARPALASSALGAEPANSVSEAMDGDRIGRPFRVGAVMFRLLKSYGITDQEIADGIAQYQAKRAAAV